MFNNNCLRYIAVRNTTKYLTGRYNVWSLINYSEGKKTAANITYLQLALRCGLMTLYYKFKSKILWEREAIKYVRT